MRFRRRLRATLVFLLLAVSVRLGAATIRGVILANELGGPPIANVQVIAVEGANPVSSLSNGTFVLEFPDKQPGEMVQLRPPQKGGMVVVNEFQLWLTLPKDAKVAPVTLLLCRASEREEMASRFYLHKSLDAIERSYQKKLEGLEAKNQATEAAREQLRIERDQARGAARSAAEQLARVKVGEASELYRMAMSLFAEEKVDEALAILDEEKLRQSSVAAREQKVAAENNLHQVIEAYALKGQLLVNKFQFDEAQKAYKAAIAVAPDDAKANFNFAAFSQDLNRFSEAENSYARALDLFRRGGDEAGAARTLNGLGELLSAQHRLKEARKAYEEALEIRRKLVQQNAATYLPDVAMTLNNLGILDSDQDRMDEARKAYEEALEIRRKLVQQNSSTHLPYVAMTLNNLGILHSRQNRMEEAGKAFDEVLGTYRKLAQQNPATYLP
jgi:tetratricopeptide (TPR) repeat protein